MAEVVECEMCHSIQHDVESYMGALGNRVWHRCRYCGHQWSETVNEESGE